MTSSLGHGRQTIVEPSCLRKAISYWAMRMTVSASPACIIQVCLRGLVSGSQQGYNGSPVRRVVAGSACWIVRVRSPKPRIEGGLRIAEFHVPVSPKDINAVWILAAFMGQGAPGVNQVGHD